MYKFGPNIIVGASHVFFKSPLSVGFVNLKPILPGHVLVTPRRVVARFCDLSQEEVSDLFLSCQKIGQVVEKHYCGEALTIALQDGAAAGQSIAHIHVHVIPRKPGDLRRNDDIYGELERQKLDSSDRPPRSSEEMSKEAAILGAYFKGTNLNE